MKYFQILVLSLFAGINLSHATVMVGKGKATLTGILVRRGAEHYVGINILSRSKHYFKIKNADSLSGLPAARNLMLVDVTFQIGKKIDSENTEVTVETIAESAQKSSPQYSEVGNK